MSVKEAMNSQITLGNLLTILVPVFIGIVTWGVSLETRIKEHGVRIQSTERVIVKMELNSEKMLDNQTKILIALENKKDR